MSRAHLTAGVVPRAMPTCRSRATLLCAFACTGAAACALAELGTTPSIVIANSIVGSNIRAIKESQRRSLAVPWSARALIRGIASGGSRCREVVVVMILALWRDVRWGHDGATFVPARKRQKVCENPKALSAAAGNS